jgi:amino acid transporter
MNLSGTGADFQERSNMICLITTAVIYPAIIVLALVYQYPITLAGLIIGGVVLQVIAHAVLHIPLAFLTRREPDDERVRSITHRSSRLAGVVLSVGVFLVIMLTIVQGWAAGGESNSTGFTSPIFTGSMLFACFIGSELTRMTRAAVLYRRG